VSHAADRISISGLRVTGTHGVLPEEQARAQPFQIDLDIESDLRRPGASDDLGDTIDYGAVADEVARIVGTEHHALLERLAERIAAAALAHAGATSVTVTVTKLRPPLALHLDGVSVTITRP
jgi:dihydroneopterin aldolase